RQLVTHPTPEGRGARPQVHRDVPDRAVKHRHELALRIRILEMEPPEDAFTRGGDVVLRKGSGDPVLLVPRPTPRLQKIPTRILEHRWLNDQHALNSSLEHHHTTFSCL